MKRLYLTVLVLVVLLTQWGSLSHDYHIHTEDESCDYCLSAQTFDHAVTPSTLKAHLPKFFQFKAKHTRLIVLNKGFYNYAARAPPRFI